MWNSSLTAASVYPCYTGHICNTPITQSYKNVNATKKTLSTHAGAVVKSRYSFSHIHQCSSQPSGMCILPLNIRGELCLSQIVVQKFPELSIKRAQQFSSFWKDSGGSIIKKQQEKNQQDNYNNLLWEIKIDHFGISWSRSQSVSQMH